MAKDTVLIFHPRTYPRDIISAVPYEFLHLERMVRDKVRMIFIDEQIDKDYEKLILENKDRILLAGVSSMTGYQLIGGVKFSKAIKDAGDIKVVWGGWHASLLPEQVLKEDFVDFVVCGQGEIAFERLVSCLKDDSFDRTIPNLGYKGNGVMHINPKEPLRNPNEFPPLDFDAIDITRYITKKRYSDRTLWYMTSFGCPNACTFCSMASVYGKAWWHRSVDEVIQHLKYLKEKTNMGAVSFEDPTFFVNREFTLELCRRMISSGLNVLWNANAHAGRFLRLFSDDDIELLCEAGLRRLFIGAESGDPEVLLKIQKNSTVADNLDIIRKLKTHNAKACLAIMVCFPWDPEKDYRNTIKMVMKAKLIEPQLEVYYNVFKPLPGTPMYDEGIKHGFVPPDTLEGWAAFMMNRFYAPWSFRTHYMALSLIKSIYFPILTKGLYRKVKGYKKIIFLIIVFILRPVFFLRFKSGSMKFPVEGYIIYYSIHLFNRITGLNWGLHKVRKDFQFKII